MTDTGKEGAVAAASGRTEAPRRRKNDLPTEILDIIGPALKVGALSAGPGFVVGGFAGIAMGRQRPVFFAIATTSQFFYMGTYFTASRGLILKAWGKDKLTSKESISLSAAAGGIAGYAHSIIDGIAGGSGIRPRLFPFFLFGLLGGSGQFIYNKVTTKKTEPPQKVPSSREKFSWMNSNWSPMKILSDADYEKMLQEKLLRVNAELALVDEKIEGLRTQEREIAARIAVESAAKT